MIANNFRKFAAAAAVQGVLSFGRPVWALGRPSTRLLRALRASRAKLINSRPQLVNWVKAITPQWVKDAMAKAKALAKQWAEAQMSLELVTEDTTSSEKTEKAKNKKVIWRVGLCWFGEEVGNKFNGRYRVIGRTHGNATPRAMQYGANA